jgi:DNA repair exonuclease SbcCD ATPase subunit
MAYAGVQDVELPPGPIAVVARYVGDPRRSNWAGKTALLEAIGWALHGTHRKRLDDGVIRNGCESTTVRLVFDNGVAIRRSRRRGKASTLDVSIDNGATMLEGSTAQDAIDRLLRLTSADLEATSWFKQGDAEAIVGQTSGKRRAVVARWLELDAWDRAFAMAKAKAVQAATKVETEARVVAELTAAALDDATAAALRAERERLEGEAGVFNAEATQSSAWRSVLDAERQAEILAANARDAANRAREARADVAGLDKPDVDLDALRRSHAQAEDFVGRARQDEREARALVGGEFDGRCPVMRAACPAADHVRGAGDAARARLADARAAIAKLEAVERETRADLEVATTKSTRHARAVERYNVALDAARGAKARLDAFATPSPAEVEAARAKLEAAEAARAEYARVSRRLGEIDATLDGERKRRARLDAAKTKEAEAVAEHAIAMLVSKAFAPSGIPARIAAEQLLGLEERANALLAGSGLSFTFGWERELRDLAPTCDACGFTFKGQREKTCPRCSTPRAMKRTDELEILVDDGSGDPEDVGAKSGGAKVLVAAAIRLAGGMMLRELRGSPVSWAVVDEPFGFLDATNREALARTFSAMLGAVGLDQAFVVSHDAALLDSLPSRLVIVRDGDASRLEIEA